jgi:hypothetical protein
MEDGTYQDTIITNNKITIAFYGSDKTNPLKTTYWDWSHYYRDQNVFQKMPPEFKLTLNNCYLIEMNLTYDEYYDPLAAFFVNTQQIVILDQNFKPILISLQPSPQVVS